MPNSWIEFQLNQNTACLLFYQNRSNYWFKDLVSFSSAFTRLLTPCFLWLHDNRWYMGRSDALQLARLVMKVSNFFTCFRSNSGRQRSVTCLYANIFLANKQLVEVWVFAVGSTSRVLESFEQQLAYIINVVWTFV